MYNLNTRVTLSQTGADGKQTITSMVTMMQDCSTLWLATEPAFASWLEQEHLAMMIANRQLDIVRRCEFGEKLRAETRVYRVKGPLGYRNTLLYDEEDEVVAASWGIGPIVSLESGKMVGAPDDIIATMLIEEQFDMDYLPKKVKLPDCDPEKEEPFRVLRADLDRNRHVNNAQWLRMACEYLPADFEARRVRMEYKQQARLGDTLFPEIYAPEEGPLVVRLLDEASVPAFVAEFAS